jgi:hypothetical protein
MNKTDYICFLIIAGLCLVAIILSEAIAMEQTTAEQYVNSAGRVLTEYGYPLIGIVLSPLISWRIVQWVKLTYKRATNKKPHWAILDAAGFTIAFVLTFWAWGLHAENAVFIALIVSCLHTSIVKAIFSYAPDKVAKVLQYGADSDHTVLTIFAGKDRRVVDREDITQPRE